MSKWQDIFSLDSWNMITRGAAVPTQNASTEMQSACIQAEMPKGQGAEECMDLISQLGTLIELYHQIPKTKLPTKDKNYFDERILALEQIQKLTEKYIELRGKDFCHKQGKKLNPPTPHTTMIGHAPVKFEVSPDVIGESMHTSVTPRRVKNVNEKYVSPRRVKDTQDNSVSTLKYQDQKTIGRSTRRTAQRLSEGSYIGNTVNGYVRDSLKSYQGLGPMDQWIESLNKRAKKKAEHIKVLMKEDLEGRLLSRDALIKKVTSPHQEGKLYPGALVEALDCMHRQVEFDPTEIQQEGYTSHIPMNVAFNQWLLSGEDTPFFYG